MTAVASPVEVARFRAVIERRLGLRVDDSGLGILADVLHRRATPYAGCGDYLDRIDSRECPRLELQRLAGDVTVAETYFFRNADQFRALIEVALRERLAATPVGLPIRILSAGCASGDEAYSIAIALRELVPHLADRVALTGFDINSASLDRATQARYSSWSLREVDPTRIRRWFRADGESFLVDPSIRRAVAFEERNLALDDPEFWFAGRFDVVFCRNVLMYFGREQARSALARITRSLSPRGYLFLGHAETLRGLSDDYDLCHSHDAFYYRRLERTGRTRPQPADGAPAVPASAAAQAPRRPAGWVDSIRDASERIRRLAADRVAVPDPAAGIAASAAVAAVVAEPSRPAADIGSRGLASALEHLRGERFDAVLAQLDGLTPAQADDPSALLLRAVSLLHRGSIAAAETICATLIGRDQYDAGAQYVLALCREASGDAAGATECAQVAAYLDPGFAMPRLHLGLLARRRGDRESARRELAAAAPLLQQEDASRLLLFGGGFEREALVALCRAEHAACERKIHEPG